MPEKRPIAKLAGKSVPQELRTRGKSREGRPKSLSLGCLSLRLCRLSLALCVACDAARSACVGAAWTH